MPDKNPAFYFKYLKTSGIQRYKRLLGTFLTGSLGYQRFIILASARSGSTLLHTYLNSSLNIQSLGEQPWRDLEQGKNANYFKSYPKLIQAVGFKVFYSFAKEMPYHEFYKTLKKEKGLKIIHLDRENILKQYVSDVQAWQKREWTLKSGTSKLEKISLDLQAFEDYVTKQKTQQERCLKDFKDQPLLSVSYESLISDPQKVLAEIQAFLGVPSRKLFTVMEKQATQSLEEILENVEEVKESYPEFFS